MDAFAIDLGTTNTAVAAWIEQAQRPRIIELSQICRRADTADNLEAPRVVPSATEVVTPLDFVSKMGQWGPLRRRTFIGKLAHIGRVALERNAAMPKQSFAVGFKHALGRAPLKTLARVGSRRISAREIAYMFVRELMAELKDVHGSRVRELVLTTPVDAYESYRAELIQIFSRLGVKKIRFLDEPVAAAIGYGIASDKERLVLVVDFGGGTLDFAVVKLGGRDLVQGTGEVVAKEGRQLGGDIVDRWLLEQVCQQLDIALDDGNDDIDKRLWLRMMLDEARRVKEALYTQPKQTFAMIPPEQLRRFSARLRGEAGAVDLSRDDFVRMLQQHGLYQALDSCLQGLTEQLSKHQLTLDAVDDVLMVGGSTLLPQVYPFFEERFGRARVRAWQPFEAVAYGASAFAAGQAVRGDFIVHDYAFVVHDAKTNERNYSVIVPRGTVFPSEHDLWKRQLVPTCPLGEPEAQFKLLICEVGRAQENERSFSWDQDGTLFKLGGDNPDTKTLVVPLNESNPTLGALRPPHPPGDRKPRLEIAFGVNQERWLVATVTDLWNKKKLMHSEPVVRLL